MSQITKLRNLPSALSEEVLTNFEFYRSISGKTHNSGPYSLKECYFKAATESSIWGIIESEQISTFLADGVSVAITVKAAIILAGIGLAECIFTLGRSRTIYTNFRLYVDTCGTESKNYSYLFFAFNFITVSTIVSFVIIAPISTVKYFFARHLPQEQNIVFDKLYEATLALDERWFAFIQLVLTPVLD